MANASEFPPDLQRTFEVTLPPGSPVTNLFAIVRDTMGGEIRETTDPDTLARLFPAPAALDPYGWLMDEYLEDLSNGLWDTPDYGTTAMNVARRMGELNRAEPYLLLRPGNFRNFLIGSGLQQHQLHGALGKAMDLLCIATGVKQPNRLSSEFTDEFITAGNLREILRGSGLAPYFAKSVPRNIARGVEKQLQTGQPLPLGELVLDGVVKFVTGKKGVVFDQIAVSSLVTLARHYYPQGEPNRAFLLQQFDREGRFE